MSVYFSVMRIILGIILIAIGALIIRFRYPIYHFTGDWGWAQKYLWGNGTVVAIILVGMLIVGIGAAYPFGAFEWLTSSSLNSPGWWGN